MRVESQIIAICHRLDQKGWVANHDGNVSVRKSDGRFTLTPTARAKFDLATEDLIEITLDGEKISGSGKPFSEWAVHRRIYERRDDVGAIIHSHAPNATAVGLANQEMMTSAIPEAVVSLGPGVPLAGLALPNSDSLWSELDPLIPHYDAVLVGGNGVFSWGKDLEQAYLRMELVEHLAKIFIQTLPLGGPKLLSPDAVRTLLDKREKAGLSLPPDPKRMAWFDPVS